MLEIYYIQILSLHISLILLIWSYAKNLKKNQYKIFIYVIVLASVLFSLTYGNFVINLLIFCLSLLVIIFLIILFNLELKSLFILSFTLLILSFVVLFVDFFHSVIVNVFISGWYLVMIVLIMKLFFYVKNN
jgi:hypothetical protein